MNKKKTLMSTKIRWLFYGIFIGAYLITLINDIIEGFNLIGFIFGTIVLIISIIITKNIFKTIEIREV